MNTNIRRWAAAGLLAAGIVGFLAPGREAQAILPGIPSIVYDPANHQSAIARYAQLIVQAAHLKNQADNAWRTLQHHKDQARRFTDNLRYASFDDAAGWIARTVGVGAPLGQGESSLDAAFARVYPRVVESPAFRAVDAERATSLNQVAYASLLGLSGMQQQFEASQGALGELRRRAQGATTDAQLQQAQSALQAFEIEEARQARQAQMALLYNQAVATADASARARWDDSTRAAQRRVFVRDSLMHERYLQRARELNQPSRIRDWRTGAPLP